MKRRPKHAPGDALTVIQAANAFREHARPFCDHAKELSPREVKRVEDAYFGEMIVSATNLAFAIELYIKALRMLHGLGPMHEHDLSKLFASLPEASRKTIQNTYAAAIRGLGGAPSRLVAVRVAHRDAPQDETQRTDTLPDDVSDASLKRVLDRSRDLFKRWRYPYDAGKRAAVVWLYYEFRWLEAIADALQNHATYGFAAGGWLTDEEPPAPPRGTSAPSP